MSECAEISRSAGGTVLKIIVVTPAAPHPFGDTTARWFYVLISELVARGHQVAAFTATEEPEERLAAAEQSLKGLSGRLKLRIHRLRVDRVPLRRKWNSLLRPGSELLQDVEFTAAVRREIDEGYDVLHLEQMSTGWLGLGAARALLNIYYFDVIDWAAKKKRFWRPQGIVAGSTGFAASDPRNRERTAGHAAPQGNGGIDPPGRPLLGGAGCARYFAIRNAADDS